MEAIKDHVCRQRGRTNLAMRYVDPDTGKQVWRTTGTANHTKALKAAAVWEAELRDGRYQKRSGSPGKVSGTGTMTTCWPA